MFVGILFSGLVSLVIAIFSVLTFTSHYKADSRYAGQSVLSFSFFWFGMAFVWLIIASMDFFRYFKIQEAAIVGTYCSQALIGASLVVAAYFMQETIFIKRRRKTALMVYGIWYALFLASLFTFKVQPQPANYFAAQIISSPVTLSLFTIGFFPLWIGAIVLFVRSILNKKLLAEPLCRAQMLMGLSLILLGIAGAIDETGIVYGWMVTAARLVTLIASIVAYSSVNGLRKQDEMIIE
ncbi:MAG: hypothetical protein AAB482_03540 [Patescibacteria group bacterium]